MKILKIIGTILLVIISVYLIAALFIPMLIGGKIVEREIIQQSPQYVISQRDAMNKLYIEYEKSEGGHKRAIKNQICSIASRIPQSQWNNNQINKLCIN